MRDNRTPLDIAMDEIKEEMLRDIIQASTDIFNKELRTNNTRLLNLPN